MEKPRKSDRIKLTERSDKLKDSLAKVLEELEKCDNLNKIDITFNRKDDKISIDVITQLLKNRTPKQINNIFKDINKYYNIDKYTVNKPKLYKEMLILLISAKPVTSSHKCIYEPFFAYYFSKAIYGDKYVKNLYREVPENLKIRYLKRDELKEKMNIGVHWFEFNEDYHVNKILSGRIFKYEITHDYDCKYKGREDDLKCTEEKCGYSCGNTFSGEVGDVIIINTEKNEILIIEVKFYRKGKTLSGKTNCGAIKNQILKYREKFLKNRPTKFNNYRVRSILITTAYMNEKGKKIFEGTDIDIYDRDRLYNEIWDSDFKEFIKDQDLHFLIPGNFERSIQSKNANYDITEDFEDSYSEISDDE